MNNLFPMSAGMYLCQRNNDLILIVVKGTCPTLKLDGGVDLGLYLRKRKLQIASKEILDNIEIFPEQWTFINLRGLNYSVFSNIEFHSTGKLSLSRDTEDDIRRKYYLLIQQGVSVTKIMRALAQEFKVSMGTIVDLVNGFDKYATT